MTIQERIQSIMDKMESLSQKNPKFRCGIFPPQWNPPVSEEKIHQLEIQNGIHFPEEYRAFMTTVADGGTQPFYGLYGITQKWEESDAFYPLLNEKFLYTVRNPLLCMELSDEAYEALYQEDDASFQGDAGLIPLCHEGCGIYSVLIVNTDDADTYGTVWLYDFANDFGTAPLINPKTHKPMSFLDWLEYYVDRTLELDDSDYFSYAEVVGKIEES